MRRDGSFSAFGDQDSEGSLWLTAFVLKTFAQAKDLIYIDEKVLRDASAWIAGHQQPDGSFRSVGFVHHQELLGGVRGQVALTAYVAIALGEASEVRAWAWAVGYLEEQLDNIDDPYTMSIVAYALGLAGSSQALPALEKLLNMAHADEDGLSWGGGPVAETRGPGLASPPPPRPRSTSTAVEATGYALQALLQQEDRSNTGEAARWLVSRRNAFGGFGSTQDTVVGLQALTEYSATASTAVDMKVLILESGGLRRWIDITPDNSDVLQIIEIPLGGTVEVSAAGEGNVVLQSVRRFNLPDVDEREEQVFEISVDYGTQEVEVNDHITISVNVRFNPPSPIEAGMSVLDIAVPTGFSPDVESIRRLLEEQPKMKRYDIAGWKVIFYIEDMGPGESVAFRFRARALFPVRAKAVSSQAYSYYRPEWKGETIGGELTVREAPLR